jgi:6-phosphofructo-2-kinase/fructose-2,6-biphosphatase
MSMQIIFLETLCNDERIIERNIRLKIQQSPDYAEQYDCSEPSCFLP